MIRKFWIGLLIGVFLYGFYKCSNRYTFNYKYLEAQSSRVLDESKFRKDKTDLQNRIESFKDSKVDHYTANFRQLIQARRCRSFLDLHDADGSPVNNYHEFYKKYQINDYPHAKNFNDIQKTVANDYLDLCLKLIKDNETYHEMLRRLTDNLNVMPKSIEGIELKKFNALTKQTSQDKQFDYDKIKYAQTRIESKRVSTKDKNKFRSLIREAKNNLKQIDARYQDKFLLMLKQGSSPDVKRLILSTYQMYLPKSWKENLIQSVSGIPSVELNKKIKSQYYGALIHPSKDLYLCSVGYPCDENSYLMYFQCLGLKYAANKEACNEPVYAYYFSDFLTQNMQYDTLKVIDYMRRSTM